MSEANEENMAPTIRIPESAYRPLKQIIDLSDGLFSRLIAALSEATPQTTQNRFEEQILSKFPELDEDELRPVVSELFRFDFVRSQSDLSVEDTAELIADSVHAAGGDGFNISRRDADLLRTRIAALLKLHRAVTLTEKASDLLMEHQHIYYSAKLYTDMRPIFIDSTDSIDAAVIIHNLVIHHGEGEVHKDFHIALDDTDLKELRQVLERAERKTVALRKLIQASGVTYLDTDEQP